MNKIRCEYCRRGCPAEEFECPRCGAPLPLHEEQFRYDRYTGMTTTTHAEPTVVYVDLPGPFMAYRKEPNVLRVERDR
jgi:hypothetical protein